MEAYVDLSEESMAASLWTPVDPENPTVLLHAPIEYQQENKVSDLAPVKLSSKALLEKLHLKYSQKSWIETNKLVRYCLDKPAAATIKGSADHPILRCIDTLQEAVKAKSLSTLLTRIESISKQKGLESHLGPNGRICYITSEMFYIEVQVKKNGHVEFVKLAHHGESPRICKELLQLLRTKDFEGFGKSLEGLLQLYSIPGDSDIKAKVYLSLRNLEEDMTALFNLSSSTNQDERITTILYGKVGFLSPRSGGTPMNTEYYITPHQILEEKRIPGNRVVGSNVSITVAGTTNWYNLPVGPLFQKSPQKDGSMDGSSPSLFDDSCISLPACFFLRFDNPEPILLPLIQKIQNITGLPVISTKQSLLHELIIETRHKCFEDLVGQEVQFVVSISGNMDQCYVLNCRLDNENAVIGALVKKIPFINPNHVPSILEILRHQAAYNTLLNSCISSTINPNDHTNMLHFEVSLQKDIRICISFQHPNGGSLSCVVVDVLNGRKLMCSLYTNSSDPPSPCSSEFIRKVMERCMSIPLTMRTVFKKAQEMTVSKHTEIKCANSSHALPSLSSEYQEKTVIEQPHSITQDSESTFTNNSNNEEYDDESMLTTFKKAQELKVSEHMEIKCAKISHVLPPLSSEYQEETIIEQPHSITQDAESTFPKIPNNEDYDPNEGMQIMFKAAQELKVSKHMKIKSANSNNSLPPLCSEYQEEAVIEQPDSSAQDTQSTFMTIPNNEDYDHNEAMQTMCKKEQELKDSEYMEIKCANSNNVLPPLCSQYQEEAEIEQPHSTTQDAEPTVMNLPNNEGYDHNEGVVHDREDGGNVHSVDLDESGSSQTLELNNSYTEDLYYNHAEIISSEVDVHNSSITEESYSSISEEPSSSIIQELSPIIPEVPSPNEAEDPNSSIAAELSLSITEELNSSVSGAVVAEYMSEHEMDECY